MPNKYDPILDKYREDDGDEGNYLPIAGGTMTGALITADHGTATDPEVVSVVYGVGAPPVANTTPIGTLFIKYTP